MHAQVIQPSDLPNDLVYALPSIVERLDLADLFPVPQPLEVELGSGDGSFLLAYAERHPERNFIGVERLLGRIRKLDRKGRRLGLRNLRGVRIECAYFLEYLLPPHCADALHIYFPDPWPKKRHHKHRLIHERFPSLAEQALTTGGSVHLRTDDPDYFEQMTSVFNRADAFERAEPPQDLGWFPTDFERDFLAAGKPIQRVSYQLRRR
ncbi:MAG: tRNA (guanosine(46)-N7)-methyltransferase TrmB [Verrucomicrobia bacterium]|jgi:tRNA (guanine-N7-)-methyltransferase|nr:tRNA (guanosine(46)-N7)-methyltransferase TrmB [Verrucomicrobiota bacterium]